MGSCQVAMRIAFTSMFTSQETGLKCLFYSSNSPQVLLLINVSHRSRSSLLPVAVWLHGGAFMFGSGSACWFGPQFWMIHDIVRKPLLVANSLHLERFLLPLMNAWGCAFLWEPLIHWLTSILTRQRSCAFSNKFLFMSTSKAHLLLPQVLVTLNYRLGPLGFLSLGSEEVPGNAGMLDQVLAFPSTSLMLASAAFYYCGLIGGSPTVGPGQHPQIRGQS